MGADLRINGYGNAALDTAEYLKHAQRPVLKAEPVQEVKDKTEGDGSQGLDEIASEVQIYLKRLNTELRFEVNKDLKDVVIKIVDPETDEVIRQIPAEEVVNIRKRMEDLIGVLYSAKT